jgi:hypothetical protein
MVETLMGSAYAARVYATKVEITDGDQYASVGELSGTE